MDNPHSDRWNVIFALAEGELGISRQTALKWKQRGGVPYRWRIPMFEAAERNGVPIAKDALDYHNPAPSPEAA